MKNSKKSKNSGVTLIALVVTIIVLMILAGIAVATLMGDNGIIKRAGEAKESQRGAAVFDEVTLAVAENAMIDQLNSINGGQENKKTKTDVVNELVTKGYLTSDDATTLETEDAITIGSITTDFSALGNVSGNSTLGAVYDSGDLKIGDKLTYSANGQSNWIVFGKDTSGNVLITTELPIDNAFTLHRGAEAWLKYESDTDSTYGLNKACSTYGGTIQGTTVHSRSIKMEDINYVAGLTPKTVTEGGNTYNIQSFDTYTFGTTNNYSEKKVNYWYPISSGGTLADGTGSGFWKRPTSENETTFKNNWYYYWCNWDDGQYKYGGADTNGDVVSASTVGLNTENLHYIWGGNTEETCYHYYAVASRSVRVNSGNADFFVASVGSGEVDANGCSFCFSASINASDRSGIGSCGVRPVVVLPSSLLVEEVETGKYDLAH